MSNNLNQGGKQVCTEQQLAKPYGYVLKTGHGNRFSEDLAHVHEEVRHMWVPVYSGAPAPAGEDAKDVEFCQPELPNPEIPAYGGADALFTTEQVKLAQVDGMIAALERRRNSLPSQYAERFDLAVEIDKLRTKRAAMSAHQAKKTGGA